MPILSAMKNMRRDRRLYEAARHHFGSWRQALRAAGLDLERARLGNTKLRRLDKRQIMEDLRRWSEAGHSLRYGDIFLQNHALATAAKNAFEGWRKALMAAGIAPQKQQPAGRPSWSRDRIVEEIRNRQREGKPLNYQGVWREASALVCAARRYFGSWDDALTAAGVGPQRCRVGRRAE